MSEIVETETIVTEPMPTAPPNVPDEPPPDDGEPPPDDGEPSDDAAIAAALLEETSLEETTAA